MPRRFIFIVFALLLAACLSPSVNFIQPTSTTILTTPPVDVVALQTNIAATTFTQLTEMVTTGTPVVQPSPTDSAIVISVRTAAVATVYAQLTETAVAGTPTTQPSPTDSAFVVSVRTAAAATAYAQITELAAITSATPTSTLTPTVVYPTLTPTPNSTSTYPTQLPYLNNTEVPTLLKTRITIQKSVFNGHAIQRITGWDYGFLSFNWLDGEHLLVNAKTGPGAEMSWPPNYPAIVNLASKKIRVPQLSQQAYSGRMMINREHLPRWSSKLDAFITTETTSSGEAVTLYSKNWDLIATYPGKLFGISPSGTKILFKNGILIDLNSGKQSNWSWNTQQLDEFLSTPNWSEDESHVFTCCYFYNNIKTGESFSSAEYDDGGSIYSGGTWMFNDKYFLPNCCLAGGMPTLGSGYIPLFDSSTKTFLKVNEMVGIPSTLDNGSENSCYMWSVAPDKKHVWAECYDGSHLINLATFEAQHFPDITGSNGIARWSANSQFALVTKYDNSVQIVSATDGTLRPLPNTPQCDWIPTGNTLLCRSEPISLLDAKTLKTQKPLDFPTSVDNLFSAPDGNLLILSSQGQNLLLLNAKTFVAQKELDLAVQVQELSWSPDQQSVVVLASDKSLWRFDYPSLENLEQLTPAIPASSAQNPSDRINSQVRFITWSPDGKFQAFLNGSDIYIVDTRVKP